MLVVKYYEWNNKSNWYQIYVIACDNVYSPDRERLLLELTNGDCMELDVNQLINIKAFKKGEK